MNYELIGSSLFCMGNGIIIDYPAVNNRHTEYCHTRESGYPAIKRCQKTGFPLARE